MLVVELPDEFRIDDSGEINLGIEQEIPERADALSGDQPAGDVGDTDPDRGVHNLLRAERSFMPRRAFTGRNAERAARDMTVPGIFRPADPVIMVCRGLFVEDADGVSPYRTDEMTSAPDDGRDERGTVNRDVEHVSAIEAVLMTG